MVKSDTITKEKRRNEASDPGRHQRLTTHALKRMQQRAVRPQMLTIILRHGQRIQQNGAVIYFLGRRHIPKNADYKTLSKAAGTAAVVMRDGGVKTVFRCKRIPRKARTRRQRRLKPKDRQ